jgi:hypothetical protein
MNNQLFNGRVDIINNTFKSSNNNLFEEDTNPLNIYTDEALKGIQVKSLLSIAFFSDKNIQIIQNNIRYNVFKSSNEKHVIGEQSPLQLQIIMRAIYLQYSKNLNDNIKQQIEDLNEMITNYCVPKILSELEQYIQYKNDVSNLYVPIPRSLNTSVAGTKTLSLDRF